MSKKNAYNQGVASGLKVATKIMEQEAEAMNYLKEKIDLIGDGQDEMRFAVCKLIENADENEIHKIFGICNPVRPVDLEDHEKKFLLNLIASLCKADINDNQKHFYNNLRHHLNISGYEPDGNCDYRSIELIETVKSIKVIAKAIRIFLFLAENNMDGVYAYEESIFSHFELRSFDEIDAVIESLYCLFGEDGLIEIYGDYESEDVSEGDIVNGCEWYPFFERGKRVKSHILDEYLTEIYLVMEGNMDIRRTITKNAVSGKAYGDYIYYMMENEADNKGELHIYSISKKTESVIEVVGYVNYYYIAGCTDEWVIWLDKHNLTNKSIDLNIFNVCTKTISTIRLNNNYKPVRGLAVIGDYFFVTLEETLYRGDMNTMEVTKMDSFATSNIREWSGKLHADGKYLYGFWSDGNYYHYVKYDTQTNIVMETCKIEWKELRFGYYPIDLNHSVYCNSKMYCGGFYPYDSCISGSKLLITCFDMKTHEASLIAEYDTKVGMYQCSGDEIYYSLQEENGKVCCEIIYKSKYGKGKHIKEYF